MCISHGGVKISCQNMLKPSHQSTTQSHSVICIWTLRFLAHGLRVNERWIFKKVTVDAQKTDTNARKQLLHRCQIMLVNHVYSSVYIKTTRYWRWRYIVSPQSSHTYAPTKRYSNNYVISQSRYSYEASSMIILPNSHDCRPFDDLPFSTFSPQCTTRVADSRIR